MSRAFLCFFLFHLPCLLKAQSAPYSIHLPKEKVSLLSQYGVGLTRKSNLLGLGIAYDWYRKNKFEISSAFSFNFSHDVNKFARNWIGNSRSHLYARSRFSVKTYMPSSFRFFISKKLRYYISLNYGPGVYIRQKEHKLEYLFSTTRNGREILEIPPAYDATKDFWYRPPIQESSKFQSRLIHQVSIGIGRTIKKSRLELYCSIEGNEWFYLQDYLALKYSFYIE